MGRRELLEGMLAELKEQPKGTSRQHYVIIGPRGIGKTNLLLMIYYAVKRRSELAEKWIPVQLAEESYSVLNLADFLLETLKALSAEMGELDEQIAAISANKDDQAVIDRSLDLLRNVADTQQKGILILVDNLDMILEDQMRDQMETHRLRSMLMAQDFITIIGTSPTLFNEITNYDSPLYNFFKTINLKELSAEEMEELIAKRLTMEGKPDQAAALAQYRPRLQAIGHLTGGNPRLLLMLYQMCEHGAIPEVKQALESLLDDLTPYFKHRMESLAPQMRKVLDTLARADHALTPTEIAREARVDVKQVNVQLARMKDEGLVTATPVRGKRSTYYDITERLFRIWYKMRLSRKDRNEVYFLAEFFEAWYQAEEMFTLITGLGERFEAVLADGDQHGAQRLLESIQLMELASTDSDVRFAAFLRECEMLLHLGKPAEAADKLEQVFEKYFDPHMLADLMGVLTQLRMQSGQWDMALRCAEKAFGALEESKRKSLCSIMLSRYEAEHVGALFGAARPRLTAARPLFITVGQVLGALDRDDGAMATILSDIGAEAATWLVFGWWLCALGRFAAASRAYATAEERAAFAGDAELARKAGISHLAASILSLRLEPASSPPPMGAAEVSVTKPQESELWLATLGMIALWLDVYFAAHGFEGPSPIPEVTERDSMIDVILASVADAVALKNATNVERVAAQFGDDRTKVAERWVSIFESNHVVFATVLRLVELGHNTVDRHPKIDFGLLRKPGERKKHKGK